MKTPVKLSVVLFALLVSGCTTITRGTRDTLLVESDPIGAKVTLSTGEHGTTPASFNLPRRKPVVVTIEREGFEPVTINVNPQVVGAGGVGMAGNILVGGLIGAGVDLATGAMKDLKPNPVRVKMNPVASPLINLAEIALK
jgi:hypothetical protein